MHNSMAEIKHLSGLTICTARQAHMLNGRGREKQFLICEVSIIKEKTGEIQRVESRKKKENWLWIVDINESTCLCGFSHLLVSV